jgi:cytochrome c553
MIAAQTRKLARRALGELSLSAGAHLRAWSCCPSITPVRRTQSLRLREPDTLKYSAAAAATAAAAAATAAAAAAAATAAATSRALESCSRCRGKTPIRSSGQQNEPRSLGPGSGQLLRATGSGPWLNWQHDDDGSGPLWRQLCVHAQPCIVCRGRVTHSAACSPCMLVLSKCT